MFGSVLVAMPGSVHGLDLHLSISLRMAMEMYPGCMAMGYPAWRVTCEHRQEVAQLAYPLQP